MIPPTRLIRTIAPLSASQIFHLLRERLPAPIRPAPAVDAVHRRHWPRRWAGARWRPPAHSDDGSVCFHGHARVARFPEVWRDDTAGRLWLYHLHYLDDLDALGVDERRARCVALLRAWIAQNPPLSGAGWEPFPSSLRIVNVVKFMASMDAAAPVDVVTSLGLQAAVLCARLERHLRANHLFENGKALVFAGAFLEGPSAERWLEEGLAIVDAECREQFLGDGAHFERSPMYHGTMLWNLADLIALADATQLAALLARRTAWQSSLTRGLEWYRALTHPDGHIAFFNDAAMGQAPALADVERYAAAVGVAPPVSDAPTWPGLRHLDSSGYVRVEHGPGHVTILDAAPVEPAYQPGHAHADTLSFELSLFGHRVVVNSGTSTYERGAQRDAERGTAAHSTVVVDGLNSSDTWASFRVGRRAVPRIVSIERGQGCVSVEAEHDGYRRWFAGAIHRRRWQGAANALEVVDTLVGSFTHACAYFHLHPEVRIEHHAEQSVDLCVPGGRTVAFRFASGTARIVRSHWHPEFGRSVPNHCIEVLFTGPALETSIAW
jgi:uncharacterized heparinase superfamily protein